MSQTTPKINIYLILVLILICSLSFGFGGFYLGQQSPPVSIQTTPTSTPTITSTSTIAPSPTLPANTTAPFKPTQLTGSALQQVKYTLPENWQVEIRDISLFFSAKNGGYFNLKAYTYPGNIGRRAFYCQITNYCIDATYFTSIKIGNQTGYEANAIDNSGGGAEYFTAKGGTFYIIESYNPPGISEFDNGYQSFLNSLVF